MPSSPNFTGSSRIKPRRERPALTEGDEAPRTELRKPYSNNITTPPASIRLNAYLPSEPRTIKGEHSDPTRLSKRSSPSSVGSCASRMLKVSASCVRLPRLSRMSSTVASRCITPSCSSLAWNPNLYPVRGSRVIRMKNAFKVLYIRAKIWA